MGSDFSEDLELYLEEVRQIPLLTAQEFHILLLRASEGDEEAQTELVNANLRLVVKIAQNYIGQGVSLSDLIQEGNIGLMKASRTFATRGSDNFIDYAEECIEKSIIIGLRELEPAKISLDTPIDLAEDEETVANYTLADFLEDKTTPTHFERVNNLQMREILIEAMETLTSHEKKVLSLRFGLEDGKTRTIDEVAKIFRVGGDNIQAVEIKALKKLRQPDCSVKLKDFY